MKRVVRILSVVMPALAFSGTPVSAQSVCYETVKGPDVLSCSKSYSTESRSADFTGSCEMVPGPDVVIEVPCPGRWINLSDLALSHAQACSEEGLSPGFISGQMCASGELRPSVGINASSIIYRYGRWGGTLTGGNHTTSSQGVTFCWATGQKKDNDATDIVVAYACE